MARTISAFDAAGSQDLHLDQFGNLAVVSGLEDVRQRVVERLQFFLGTWFLEVDAGVPYRSEVFVRGVSAGLASALVSDHIRATPGVTDVRDVVASINRVDREFSYTATIETPYGETTVER